MDGGSFRAPRPLNTKSMNRSESKQAEPALSIDEPEVVKQLPERKEPVMKEKSPKRTWWPLIIVVLVVLGVAAWLLWPKSTSPTGIDTSKYQAVFFTNGNVYFGKLQPFNDEYVKLTNVYYPQTQASNTDDTDQSTGDDQTNVTLLKMSDQIHGPENEMLIAKNQIQFFQNLRSDSKVADLIKQQK